MFSEKAFYNPSTRVKDALFLSLIQYIIMMDIHSSLVTFVGDEILLQEEGNRPLRKWSSFVDGKDGFLYGIPNKARVVAKFNTADKSMEFMGTQSEGNYGWECGVLAKNGCINCPPYYHMKMLKINTLDGTVETFNIDLLLPGVGLGSWMSGVVGPDGCIYYMPRSCNHILRVALPFLPEQRCFKS